MNVLIILCTIIAFVKFELKGQHVFLMQMQDGYSAEVLVQKYKKYYWATNLCAALEYTLQAYIWRYRYLAKI